MLNHVYLNERFNFLLQYYVFGNSHARAGICFTRKTSTSLRLIALSRLQRDKPHYTTVYF